ncbi:MAG: hypothetical protein H6612_06660 [Ignavibacteriales bacterium]|nr:hypothetical protein [Ignavibacteriales bacterium]MCB9259024.1 hypothetical protein [Ignavibacteriales bacterium]
MSNKHIAIILSTFLFNITFGQSITETPHNLSISGPGAIKATSESEICIFCHTPHRSSPRNPLWNREDQGINYTLYNSSTLHANPGQPDGSSILCLSCHDGTIALGNILSREEMISFSGNIMNLPSGKTNLESDLSDDHVISFTYSSQLSAQDGELKEPSTLVNKVRLENSKLQCISCHDPHINLTNDFLVETNEYSVLCINCHEKDGWNNSSHKNSAQNWSGSGIDPWPNSSYSTVSQNGCENCHVPHNAEGKKRNLNYFVEENNCIVCHNGNVASTDIQNQLTKFYKHDVNNYLNIHDPVELNTLTQMHVECIDCHNPHKANNSSAQAPFANGFIKGVKGVDTDGLSKSEIDYQYELCYRCHADSPTKPGSVTSRQIEQNNTRQEFDISNPSFHPVEGPGKNNNVPSLLSPYSESSYIYCTDCHASDGSNSPKGPHGSSNNQILKYNYNTIYGAVESYQSYELCYQCHSRDVIINGTGSFSRKVHYKHIIQKNIPCNFCHDPHGISSTQGNQTNNSHLINFDLSEAEPLNGILQFTDNGNFSGSCYLICHGRNHATQAFY